MSSTLDPARVVRLARFHRVQALVWNAIAALPDSPRSAFESLAADATEIAGANLRATAACAGLLAAFEQAGLRLLFLKGLPLGMLAYGSATLKSAVDIDLLVAPGELGEAAALIEGQGYRLVIPKARPGGGALRRWHRIRKESLWAHPRSTVQLDLHTSVADNPRLIPSIGLSSPTRRVDVGNGVSLPALQPTETFAYLAVHGASSAWFRLKWISDFAALLAGASPDEIETLYRQSQELEAGRAPAQALLLADRLFGTLESHPSLRAELMGESAVRRLYRAALEQLAGRTEPVEPTSRRLGTLRIHWTQFLLLPGMRFKLSELARQARSALA